MSASQSADYRLIQKLSASACLSEREKFGHYLSGLVDGEGYFTLFQHKQRKNPSYHAVFGMKLRRDDSYILEEIVKFLKCGTVRYSPNFATFGIADVWTIQARIVPNFFRFPLRAKKSRDFKIWSEGVDLLANIKHRPIVMVSNKGRLTKWTENDVNQIEDIMERLRNIRRFPT